MHTLAKCMTALSSLCLLIGTVEAAPRTETQSCSRMKAAVKSNGTLIRRFKGRNIRFVNHQGYCDHFETLRWRVVQASDGRCYLKMCEEVTERSFR